MRFPNCFSGEKREIYVKGEVYLEVARDEEHPFVVYAGENEVRVLGTRFNLTAYPDEQKVDVSIYTSWVSGTFEYERMSLFDITRQLSRWYDVEFVYEAEEFRNHPFTGIVKRDQSLENVLKNIEETTNIKFEISERVIIIKRAENAANISRSGN